MLQTYRPLPALPLQDPTAPPNHDELPHSPNTTPSRSARRGRRNGPTSRRSRRVAGCCRLTVRSQHSHIKIQPHRLGSGRSPVRRLLIFLVSGQPLLLSASRDSTVRQQGFERPLAHPGQIMMNYRTTETPHHQDPPGRAAATDPPAADHDGLLDVADLPSAPSTATSRSNRTGQIMMNYRTAQTPHHQDPPGGGATDPPGVDHDGLRTARRLFARIAGRPLRNTPIEWSTDPVKAAKSVLARRLCVLDPAT